MPRLSLSDGSVRLRPLAEKDVPSLIAAVSDPLISRFTFWPDSMSPEEAVERIRRAEASRVAGTRLELAVVEPATDELVGFVGLEPDWQDRRAALFYWTTAQARGRGIARCALGLLSDWAFSELDMQRLELDVDADNVASQRVAQAAGFQQEGVLRSRRLRADGRCDSIIFARLQ